MEELLRNIGLSQYESKVYIALLELGNAKVGQILKKAKIQSGKIYQILDSLENKGFISIIEKNGVKEFFPSDPKEIRKFLEQKKQTINNLEIEYEKILPNLLKKINTSKSETHFEIYTGLKGMKKAFEKETKKYQKKKEFLISGVIDYNKHEKKVIDFFEYNIWPKREQAKIVIKKIMSIDAKKNKKEKNTKIKVLPYTSHITFNIIDNLTLVSIWLDEPIFLCIESKEIAKGFKENFKHLWKIAK